MWKKKKEKKKGRKGEGKKGMAAADERLSGGRETLDPEALKREKREASRTSGHFACSPKKKRGRRREERKKGISLTNTNLLLGKKGKRRGKGKGRRRIGAETISSLSSPTFTLPGKKKGKKKKKRREEGKKGPCGLSHQDSPVPLSFYIKKKKEKEKRKGGG